MGEKLTLKDFKAVEDNWKIHPWNIRIMGPFSTYFAYFFNRIFPSITPNQISFFWGFLGIIACFFIALGGYWNMVLGAVIYHVALLFDYIDGNIAKAHNRTTIGGTYLDRLLHYLHRGLLLLALGIGIFNETGNIFYLYAGLSACLFFTFDNLNKLKVYETLVNEKRFDLIEGIKKSHIEEGGRDFDLGFFARMKAYIIELLRPNNPFSFFFAAIILSIPGWSIFGVNAAMAYLLLMAVISIILFFKSLALEYSQIGNISTKRRLNTKLRE